eukprot:IDg11261t1
MRMFSSSMLNRARASANKEWAFLSGFPPGLLMSRARKFNKAGDGRRII